MVTLIWQFTAIWNDFLFGVAFSGADSKPITVGLNNMVQHQQQRSRNYNVDMAAARHCRAAHACFDLHAVAGTVFRAKA